MEHSIPERLGALQKLQEVDSKLDELKKLRGALPEEVQDLEDEVAGFVTRQKKQEEEIEVVQGGISSNKSKIKDAEQQIKVYEEQQNEIKNNREYEAISKEIEYQQLEIQLLEQKNKKCYAEIEELEVIKSETLQQLEEKQSLLENKKQELEALIEESKAQEEDFIKIRNKIEGKVEERLRSSYEKIRSNARNGLAVVSIKRNACGGCFNVVPPQRQAEVQGQKKILVCEHCGRILCNVIAEDPPPQKKKASRRKSTKTTKSAASTSE